MFVAQVLSIRSRLTTSV